MPLRYSLISLLLLSSSTVSAQVSSSGSTRIARSTVLATKDIDPSRDALIAKQGETSVWLRSPASVLKLANILRRAPLDGLSNGPDLAVQVEVAAREAASGDAQAVLRADHLLSSAWLTYVAALNLASPEVVYADQSLALQTPESRATLRMLASAPSLPEYLELVAAVNPIYASLRDAAWATMQRTGSTALDPRLMKNLARARALPRTGRFLVVNAATQRLTMIEDGRIADSMKIIVGTRVTPTPMLASTIWYVTVNPYWYVPTDLTRNIVAGRMLANPKYLSIKRYEVISDFGEAPSVLSPLGIDWKAVRAGKTIVYLRQLPGEHNSMGKMKFSFPSDTGVYLHDTDLPGLFAKEPRTLSNGCVRLEDAQRLGRWLMGHDVNAQSGEPEEHLVLPRGVPVFLTYITAQVENGEVTFVPDVYGRDEMSGMHSNAR